LKSSLDALHLGAASDNVTGRCERVTIVMLGSIYYLSEVVSLYLIDEEHVGVQLEMS
jgi:hypothetical protein